MLSRLFVATSQLPLSSTVSATYSVSLAIPIIMNLVNKLSRLFVATYDFGDLIDEVCPEEPCLAVDPTSA